MGVIFGGLLKFQIFLGVLEIHVFFVLFFFLGGGGRTVDAGPEPTLEEKMRVPPPPLGLSHDNH